MIWYNIFTMNLNVLNETNAIIDLIKNSGEYKEFLFYKEKIENNDEIIKNVIKRDSYINELADLKRFDKDNIKKEIEIKKTIKKYEDAIFSFEDVKIYKEKEANINEIIDFLNDNLFNLI